MAATAAAKGTVTTQATTILLSTLHCTLLGPLSIMPTATMEPIWQCVLLTGMPAHKTWTLSHSLWPGALMQSLHTHAPCACGKEKGHLHDASNASAASSGNSSAPAASSASVSSC